MTRSTTRAADDLSRREFWRRLGEPSLVQQPLGSLGKPKQPSVIRAAGERCVWPYGLIRQARSAPQCPLFGVHAYCCHFPGLARSELETRAGARHRF